MTWLVAALLASLAWAIVQLVDKTLIDAKSTPSTDHYLVASGISALLPVALFPFVLRQHLTTQDTLTIVLSCLAGVCYFVSNSFFFRAVAHIDASVSSAALAAVPGMTAVGSWLVLSEALGWLPVAGIIAISIGVFVMSRTPKGRTTTSKRVPLRAWVFLAIAELILVVEYLIEGAAAKHLPAVGVFFWTRVGVLACMVALVTANRQFVMDAIRWAFLRSRRVGYLTVTNECLDMIAITLLIASYRSGPVGVATAVAYTQSAFVFILTLAANTFRPNTVPTEGDRRGILRWRVVGLVLVLVGVFLSNAYKG